MVEAFGREIKKSQKEGKIKGITMAKNILNVTHPHFEDDTYLPGESSIVEVRNLKYIYTKIYKNIRVK